MERQESVEYGREVLDQGKEIVFSDLDSQFSRAQHLAEEALQKVDQLPDDPNYQEMRAEILDVQRQLTLLQALVASESDAFAELKVLETPELRESIKPLIAELDGLLQRLERAVVSYEYSKDIVRLEPDSECAYRDGTWSGQVAVRRVNGALVREPYGKGNLAMPDGRVYYLSVLQNEPVGGFATLETAENETYQVYLKPGGLDAVGVYEDAAGRFYVMRFKDGVVTGTIPITTNKYQYRANMQKKVEFTPINEDQVLVDTGYNSFVLDYTRGLVERTPQLFTEESNTEGSVYAFREGWQTAPSLEPVCRQLKDRPDELAGLESFYGSYAGQALAEVFADVLATRETAQLLQLNEQGYDTLGMLHKYVSDVTGSIPEFTSKDEAYAFYQNFFEANKLSVQIQGDGSLRLGFLSDGKLHGRVIEVPFGTKKAYAIKEYYAGEVVTIGRAEVFDAASHVMLMNNHDNQFALDGAEYYGDL